MATSFWERSPYYNTWDIAIVGGGLAGLNLAYSIKEKAPALTVKLLEKGSLDLGASRKNAGFCCFGSPTELLEDIRNYGEKAALDTAEARWEGLKRMKSILEEGDIGWENARGHELIAQESELEPIDRNLGWLNAELEKRFGFGPYKKLDDKALQMMGFKGFAGIYGIEGEAMLDPFQLHRALLKKVERAEVDTSFGTPVEEIEEQDRMVKIHVKGFDVPIQTKSVAIACNGFSEKLLGDPRIQPARGQVLLTEALDELPFQGTFHMDQGNYYFRNVGKRVLLGGGRELDSETERTDEVGSNPRIRGELERILRENLLPGHRFQIEEAWSGIMGFTNDKRPILEALGDRRFLMGGFSGMGVALSFWAGKRMAKQILERIA